MSESLCNVFDWQDSRVHLIIVTFTSPKAFGGEAKQLQSLGASPGSRLLHIHSPESSASFPFKSRVSLPSCILMGWNESITNSWIVLQPRARGSSVKGQQKILFTDRGSLKMQSCMQAFRTPRWSEKWGGFCLNFGWEGRPGRSGQTRGWGCHTLFSLSARSLRGGR